MRNVIHMTIGGSLAAVLALVAPIAHAEPSMDHSSTIKVDDGNGGWKPHTPPAKPGPGISVTDENGNWVPYKPQNPVRKAPKPIKHVKDKRTGWTYYLAQDRNTGQMFVQIEDANGNDVHINGDVPMPGGGPLYPVR